jgi:RNA-binding protein
MKIKQSEKKALKAAGHKLKPVITIGMNGLSKSLLLEFEKTIDHHELIKIRIRISDKSSRKELIEELCYKSKSQIVNTVGNTAIIFRKNPKSLKKFF